MQRIHPLYLDTDDMPLNAMQSYGQALAEQQRDTNWHVGDLAIRARRELGADNMSQVFPEWVSPGWVARCEAVAKAYPKEFRNPAATWTQHMQVAKEPDRFALVAQMVDKGQTSDESRNARKTAQTKTRWLLAVDVNYWLVRTWSSGAGVEAAKQVTEWLNRLVDRLKDMGLTDVMCCMDSPRNFRKDLTDQWEDGYKPRAKKEPELVSQLQMIGDMLEREGFCVEKQDGYEADDLLASAAKQFAGKVTLLTCDKDMRQCLSSTCNMLTGIEWNEDPTSGDLKPEYEWVSSRQHHDEGATYNGVEITGISPGDWATQFQTLAGDSGDGVRGAENIGAKGAMDMVKEFGTVELAIQAAHDGDDRLKPKQRESLIEFESKLDVTRQLVTLVDTLSIPKTTRI